MPATLATLAGCAAAWGGLFIDAMRPLYDFAWFVGFAVAAAVYLVSSPKPSTTRAAAPRQA
jgi:cytosine/uracil/thiamine/allantoin permease